MNQCFVFELWMLNVSADTYNDSLSGVASSRNNELDQNFVSDGTKKD